MHICDCEAGPLAQAPLELLDSLALSKRGRRLLEDPGPGTGAISRSSNLNTEPTRRLARRAFTRL